jgi:hypothetical protein
MKYYIIIATFLFSSFGLSARTEGIIKVYRGIEKTFSVSAGTQKSTKETYYLIFEYDSSGTIIKQKKISFGKDSVGKLWQETIETTYRSKIGQGSKEIQYNYFYDSAAADGDGLAYLLSGAMKPTHVAFELDDSKKYEATAPSLKGQAFEYDKADTQNNNLIATTNFLWRLDSKMTKEANGYLSTMIIRPSKEMADFDKVVSYLESTKLSKYKLRQIPSL